MNEPGLAPIDGDFTAGALTALVLAGQRGGRDAVAEAAGVAQKCLAPVAGVPMLARVVRTMASHPWVGRVLVSLPDPRLIESLPIEAGGAPVTAVASAPSPASSVQAAVATLERATPLLLTTGDHPLLTVAMIEVVRERALASDADLVVALADAERVRAAYPGERRTAYRFRDGRVCGCNLFLLRRPAALNALAFWRHVEQERKRPWKIVGRFGIVPLFAYLAGRLFRDEALARAGQVFQATVAAAPLPWPEAAVDVDTVADWRLVDAILRRRHPSVS